MKPYWPLIRNKEVTTEILQFLLDFMQFYA
jgi:hypothetical protein